MKVSYYQYWTIVPLKTKIAREEKSMPGFKASNDRLTFLGGYSSKGSLKLTIAYYFKYPKDIHLYVALVVLLMINLCKVN
jgi:hypothetical protein